MGACQPTQVDHEAALGYMQGLRSGGNDQILIVGIKDQAYTPKVYLCGAGASDRALIESLDAALAKTNTDEVERESDVADVMWDVAWHNTQMTNGALAFLTKPWFPIGKNVLGLLDALAQHGWVPTAAPNYGGAVGDKGRSVSWPTIIFGKDERYTKESLFIAVKDQTIPRKICAAGPPKVIAGLNANLTPQLKKIMPEVEVEFDEWDTEETWDLVWQNAEITTGTQIFLAKSYFPKGKICMIIFKEIYKLGWRLVAAPNFGGNDVDWPCFIFRALARDSQPPALLMGAIKDSNIPGKFCFAGDEVAQVARALVPALQRVAGNGSVELRKDQYDEDWDEVLRNTTMTNGSSDFLGFQFSMQLPYFPRCDSMMVTLNKLNELGWSLAACPNFGGMGESWPTFIWEKRNAQVQSSFVAIKDQNFPGKVCFGGGLQRDGVAEALLRGFQALAGKNVVCAKDGWDESYDLCYRNTRMTSGGEVFSLCCSGQSFWWPFGFPLEMMLSELNSKGWRAVGGPNFGQGALSWPALVLERTRP